MVIQQICNKAQTMERLVKNFNIHKLLDLPTDDESILMGAEAESATRQPPKVRPMSGRGPQRKLDSTQALDLFQMF